MRTPETHDWLVPAGSYLGKCVLSRRFGRIGLSEAVFTLGDPSRWHAHAVDNVYLVASGALSETTENARTEHGPNTLVYQPAGRPHRTLAVGASTRVVNLHLDEAWVDSLPARHALEDASKATVGGLGSRLVESLHAPKSPEPGAVEALVSRLLSTLGSGERSRRNHSTAPAWLASAHRIVREHLPEAIPLEDLAARVGVDRCHLARTFRRHLGLSVGEIVRFERVRLAADLLPDARYSLAEIAARCGYADQSHMTRAFRARFGTTPGRARGRPGVLGEYRRARNIT